MKAFVVVVVFWFFYGRRSGQKMPGTPCKNRKKDPVELVRATARRLSADLRDVQGFIGRECRDAGRELREFQQEMTTRLRRSSLQGLPSLPRIDLPRIGISFADGPRYSSVEDVKLPSCQGASLRRRLGRPLFQRRSWPRPRRFCHRCRTGMTPL